MAQSAIQYPERDVTDQVREAPIRVLHVDDEADFLKAARQILEMQGTFHVNTASSVEEAMEKMRQKPYDVIVSDYIMPGKGGLEFLKELRERGNNIPFIIFTGRGREEVAIEALNLGADRYFNKVGDPRTVYGELVHAIHQVVQSKRAEDALTESEEKYRNLFEYAMDPIVTLDLKGNVTSANRAVAKYGFTGDEMIGKNVTEFVPKRYWPSLLKDLAMLSQGKTSESETEIVTPKGKILAEYKSSSIKHGKKVVGIQTIIRDITERKKAETALRRSEQKLRNIIDTSPDLIIWVDTTGKITLVNRKGFELTGFSEKDIIGRSLTKVEALTRKSKQKILEALRKRLEGIDTPLYEIELVTKKGGIIPAELSASPIYEGDRIVGTQSIVRDLRRRKKTEEALRESREKFESLFAGNPEPSVYVDSTYHIQDVNPRFEELFGYSLNEIKGKHINDVVVPKEKMEEARILDRKAQKGHVYFNTVRKRKDGSLVPVSISVAPINIKGQFTGYMAVYKDISQLKKSERELKKSEERYRALLEETPVGICNLDIKGNIIYVNRKFEEVTGFSRREALGKNAFSVTREALLASEENLKLVIRRFKSKLMGRSTGPIRFPLKSRDGTLRWLEGEAKLIKRFGVPVGLQAVMRDITELVDADKSLKKTLEKLKVLNEKLGVVGKLTRHDALNKLSTVTMNTFLAKQKLAHDPEALKHLSEIESACEEVERIFNFARIYEKIGMEELTYIDVEKTFTEAVMMFSSLQGIKVVNDCKGLTVLADSLLRQLFYNLIDNSLEHGEKVSQIRVYCEKAGKDQLKLVHEDNGAGIPKAEKEKIFAEGNGKGTGYGLHLIRKMCEVYSWTIKETGKQGKGAQFTISIPKIGERGKVRFKLH